MTNEILLQEEFLCSVTVSECLNSNYSLGCDKVIFPPISLLWRDIKKLLQIQELVAGYSSFVTEVSVDICLLGF